VGRVSVDVHNEAARALGQHLGQPDPRIGDRLEGEMRELAAAEHFEAAGRRRDQLKALEVIGRRQRVLGAAGWDRVAVALWRETGRIAVACVHVVDGAVAQADTYASADDPVLSDQEALVAVLAELALPAGVTPVTVWQTTASRRARGARERGLLAFALSQARSAWDADTTPAHAEPADLAEALARLAQLLGLPGPLRHIECMDVSHTQGRHTVGSVVSLRDGVVQHRDFRVVHLKDVDGDDYAAMHELVRRRTSGRRLGLDTLPDLVLIDGGPGQVAAALAAFTANGLLAANASPAAPGDVGVDGPDSPLVGPALAGLAKRFEELWPVGASRPLSLSPHDPVLRMLTSARDHAHRHALHASRRRRERAALRTGLDDVDGVGAARRKALLAHFGTLDAIARAPVTELETVSGIGPGLARRIAAHFDGTVDAVAGRPGQTPETTAGACDDAAG
jgi:excinuclease ABC subunit C